MQGAPYQLLFETPPSLQKLEAATSIVVGVGFSDDSRAKLTDPFCLCCLSPLMQFPLFSLEVMLRVLLLQGEQLSAMGSALVIG